MIEKYLYIPEISNVRENFDGTVELIDSNGMARLATADETATAKRLQLHDTINAERERRETLGQSYQFPDGLTGTIQMRNSTDFRNIAGLTSAATILMMQGVTDPVLYFTDAENIRHAMTPSEMIGVGIAVQQRISALYSTSAQIKKNLEASNPDTFDISLNWPV